MQFHNFFTAYDAYCKVDKQFSAEQIYDKLLGASLQLMHSTSIQGMQTEVNRNVCERRWYRNQQPYYKVYPAMLNMLADVGLDIPCEYVRTPFDCFAIHFPIDDNPYTLKNGMKVQSILVYEAGTTVKEQQLIEERRLFLWIHVGEFEEYTGCPILNYLQIHLEDGKSLQEKFDSVTHSASDIDGDTASELLKIAVSICFLATGSDKLVSPDVLSKDLGDWLNAVRSGDTNRRHTIENCAVRRGKKGWNVGVGERFFARQRTKEHGDSTTGHELTYSHMRCCHFRLLPKTKIPKFIKTTIVRPDLEPKQ